jgi:anti-sigma factor RsiW
MTPPIGPHLGERVSAFVDGALADDARDRSLVHLAGCPECHEQVEAARLLKSRLVALPAPEISTALIARLLAMAEPGGPIPPRPARLPGQPRPASAPRPVATVPGRPTPGRPAASRPAGRPTGRRDRENVRDRRRTVRLAALAGAALSTMVVAVVGLSGAVGSDVQPRPVTQLSTNVVGTSDPFVDVSRTLQRVSRSTVLAPTP